MNVTFIGGGNMASAMIGGLLAQGWRRADLRVVEIAARRARAAGARIRGARRCPRWRPPRRRRDCVVLAVKPQQHAREARCACARISRRSSSC